MLLNFFRVRLVVNDDSIYDLQKDKAVAITVPANHSKLVATDGFHHTKPIELNYKHINTFYFKISCAIDDDKLIAGIILFVLFYSVGLISGILIAKILSFFPILYFLYLYYINPKEFITIKGYYVIKSFNKVV